MDKGKTKKATSEAPPPRYIKSRPPRRAHFRRSSVPLFFFSPAKIHLVGTFGLGWFPGWYSKFSRPFFIYNDRAPLQLLAAHNILLPTLDRELMLPRKIKK